MIGHRLGLGL